MKVLKRKNRTALRRWVPVPDSQQFDNNGLNGGFTDATGFNMDGDGTVSVVDGKLRFTPSVSNSFVSQINSSARNFVFQAGDSYRVIWNKTFDNLGDSNARQRFNDNAPNVGTSALGEHSEDLIEITDTSTSLEWLGNRASSGEYFELGYWSIQKIQLR